VSAAVADIASRVGSKNTAKLKVPISTQLKVRGISPSQPLEFNCRRWTLPDVRR
jgi:hypothetical protein